MEDYVCGLSVLTDANMMYFTADYKPLKYTHKIMYNDKPYVYSFRLPEKYLPKTLRIDEKKNIIDPETEQILTLGDLNFAVGSSQLQTGAEIVLDKIVEFLEDNPSIKLEIAAHTDNTGTENINQALSEKRAKAVMDYLTNKKVSIDRLVPKGYGSKQPITDNTTPEGKTRNRRVNFRVL